MISVNTIILMTGILLLLGIGSSKFSTRIGMPMLVLFLGVGMLAGSEGIGRIAFEDYHFANIIGSIALAVILFDGGLHTTLQAVQTSWRAALPLATVGVLLTSVLTGAAAAWILGIPLLHGMLLGSIVGSTDAAAVFSTLRTSGLRLSPRVTAILEVESGSNDPMAIFLTVALISLIMGTANSFSEMILFFILQFGVGSIVGIGGGFAAVWLANRINLDYPGLYPILVLACGLLIFGVAAVFEGSGFLAVYLAGIVLANKSLVYRNGILQFHDAAAWLSQIVLFVMLGLLSFPSRLTTVALDGLIVALVLIFIARPVAVWLSIFPLRLNLRELTFLSWVGLKGAVPVTLATFPLLAGVPHSQLIFNVVFFVVLISAITQGWSLAPVARWLRLGIPADTTPPITMEINALRHVDGEIVEYRVAANSLVADKTLRDLALPYDMTVTLVVRDDEVIMPRGSTVLKPGDKVFVAMRKKIKPLLDCLFDTCAEPLILHPGERIIFRADHTVRQLCTLFSLGCQQEVQDTLGSLIKDTQLSAPYRLGPFLVTPGTDAKLVTLVYSPLEISTLNISNQPIPQITPETDQAHNLS
ncbi:MAG: potassium/proton antiporter [Desulfobulbus oligotrophicus]|jgi:cell volume regulation protein A|nr:potassium/proton antiporter [Desulfobulbus oligotrophicus]